MLLARAIARAAPYLEAYDIGTAPTGKSLDSKVSDQCVQDKEAKESLSKVLGLVQGEDMRKAFDEGDFFTSEDAPVSLGLTLVNGTDVPAAQRAVQDAFQKRL